MFEELMLRADELRSSLLDKMRKHCLSSQKVYTTIGLSPQAFRNFLKGKNVRPVTLMKIEDYINE